MKDDPSLIIQYIQIKARDVTGAVTTLTCAQYFKAFSNMTQFLPNFLPWLINVAKHNDYHITEGIFNKNKSNRYTYNPFNETRLPWDQTKDLVLSYTAASQADRYINLHKKNITDQLKSNHTLMHYIGVYQI